MDEAQILESELNSFFYIPIETSTMFFLIRFTQKYMDCLNRWVVWSASFYFVSGGILSISLHSEEFS